MNVRVRLRDRADAKRVQVPRLSRRHVSRRHVPHTNKLKKKKYTINNRRSLSVRERTHVFSVRVSADCDEHRATVGKTDRVEGRRLRLDDGQRVALGKVPQADDGIRSALRRR